MTDCTVECTAIPDGFIGADNSRLRLSVILRPCGAGTARPASVGVDLSRWPTEVPQFFFRIWAGASKTAMLPVATVPARESFEEKLTGGITASAQSWWSSIWSDPTKLAAYLALLEGEDPQQEVIVASYNYTQLHDAAMQHAQDEFVRAHVAYQARNSPGLLESRFEGLALRAARDPNDQMVRIARSLAIGRSAGLPRVTEGLLNSATYGAGIRAQAYGPKGVVASGDKNVDEVYSRALDPEYLGDTILPAANGGVTADDPTNNQRFEAAIATDDELGAVVEPEWDDAHSYAHEVLGALQAHPALRKFARQLADLTLDAGALRTACNQQKGDVKGIIAVELAAGPDAPGPAPSGDAVYTAFALRTDTNALFEPCPRAEFDPTTAGSVAAGLPLRDGFVVPEDLPEGHRFRICSVDGIAAYFALNRSIQSTNEAYHSSERIQDVATEPTGFRTRGLMLLDTKAEDTANAVEARPKEIAKDHLLFAEDLVDGYRVDVVDPKGVAHPACARVVDYPLLDSLGGAASAYYQTSRNDGHVAPMARTWTSKPDKGSKTTLTVSQVLTTWTGRPLGLPSPDQASTSSKVPGLAINYAFDPRRPGPILRHFGRYRFLVRARKLNGSSVAVVPTRVDEFALGSRIDGDNQQIKAKSDDPGFQFGFVEKAPAPTILVDDTFDPRPAAGSGLADRETPTSIRVTAGDKAAKVRWLVLPAMGFDLAELQGQFDPRSNSDGDRRRAEQHALHGAYGYLEHDQNGGFASIKAENPLALLMKPQAISDTVKTPAHFVDATLQTLGASLIARKATPPQAFERDAPDRDLTYFPRLRSPRDFDPDAVTPIRIEVFALPNGKKTTIRVGPDYPLQLPHGTTIKVPTLRIGVAPADTLDLDLWNIRTFDAFKANPAMARMEAPAIEAKHPVARLFVADRAAAEGEYQSLMRSYRVASLGDHVPITIEHPVAQPLREPRLTAPLNVYRAASVEAWRTMVDDEEIEDEPDTAKLFVTGELAIDRKSTGEVWAEAFWVDPCSKDRIFRTIVPEALDRIEQNGLYDYRKPIQFRRLFTLPALGLPHPHPGESDADYLARIDKVNLTLLDVMPPGSGEREQRIARCLTADFDCDKHRTLAIRIVARSRFAPPPAVPAPAPVTGSSPGGPAPAAPPPPPPTTEDDLTTAPPEDMTNIQQTASRAACIAAVRDGDRSGVKMIELLATRRPPPPYVMRDKGTLYRRELRTAADGSGKELVHIYRCWLDGDWYESGDDEKLAIVCRQSRSATLPGWADVQTSRWGGDATSAPGQELRTATMLQPSEPTRLIAEQIAGAEIKQATLTGGAGNPGQSAQVALACLTPQFHSGFGRWFCDIELKATGAFKVGLKLVLARFQEKSVAGRALSTTLPIDIVMLHQPWRFNAKRTGRTVEITVTGPAYQERAPMLDKMAGVSDGATFKALSDLIGNTGQTDMRALAQTPLIVAELERLDSNGKGPMPVISAGRAIATSNLGVAVEGIKEDLSNLPSQVLLRRWKLTLDIPPEHADQRLAVRIGLASAHANSHARRLHSTAASQAPAASDGNRFQPSALDGPMVLLPEPIVVQLRV